MNLELKKVKEWCDINKLSINLKKSNYMIVKSPRKKNTNVNINITLRDGSCHTLERKAFSGNDRQYFNLEISHLICVYRTFTEYRSNL